MTDSTALATITHADALTLAPLVKSADGYRGDARSKATRTAYTTDYATFATWTASRGLASMPASQSVVAVYVASMADRDSAYATIARAVAGIGHEHRAQGHAWDVGPAVREVLAGIRRRIGVAQVKKSPVLADDLGALVSTLGVDLLGLRDRALLTLGWFSATRRSEVVALDVADVSFTREGLIVTICKSKTDQEGVGRLVGVPYASDPARCPVRSLQAWMTAATITSGPVFRAVNRHGRVASGRLSGRTVARVVQRSALAAGLDPAKYGGHSLRAGFATSAAAKGKSLDAIMKQTGHRSERIARGYIRHADLFTDNAAAGLV